MQGIREKEEHLETKEGGKMLSLCDHRRGRMEDWEKKFHSHEPKGLTKCETRNGSHEISSKKSQVETVILQSPKELRRMMVHKAKEETWKKSSRDRRGITARDSIL